MITLRSRPVSAAHRGQTLTTTAEIGYPSAEGSYAATVQSAPPSIAPRQRAAERLPQPRRDKGVIVSEVHYRRRKDVDKAPNILKISEVRVMRETKATELATPLLTGSTILSCRQILDEMARVDYDDERRLAPNRELHTAIYPACGWPRLYSLIDAHRHLVEPYLRASLTFLGRRASAHREHRRILKAAETRDGRALARFTCEHLCNTARWRSARSGRRSRRQLERVS